MVPVDYQERAASWVRDIEVLAAPSEVRGRLVCAISARPIRQENISIKR